MVIKAIIITQDTGTSQVTCACLCCKLSQNCKNSKIPPVLATIDALCKVANEQAREREVNAREREVQNRTLLDLQALAVLRLIPGDSSWQASSAFGVTRAIISFPEAQNDVAATAELTPQKEDPQCCRLGMIK